MCKVISHIAELDNVQRLYSAAYRSTTFGLAPIDSSAGVEQQLIPVAPHGQVPSVPLGQTSKLVPVAPHAHVPYVLGQTSAIASQTATHALGDQGSVGMRSELSRMLSETSVPNPHEPRGHRRERQVSMDSGRGQIALPRLDQRMSEDMHEPQRMPTIHENARINPLMFDDPWSRVRTSNHAACMSNHCRWTMT
eukprot:6490744-Amphidinium_carterae.3